MNSKALAKGIAKISLIVFALFLFGFFVLNFVLPVLAPEGETKQIYFVVKDSSGNAVRNAKVEMFVSDSLEGEYVYDASALTGSDGTVVISTSSVDKYAYFVVSKLGYENSWPDSGEPSMSAERYVINVSDIISSAENPITVTLDVIPAIWTDKSEYMPEETVYIYGSAFDCSTVHLTIEVQNNVVNEQDVNIVDGGFETTFKLNGITDTYTITASYEGKVLATTTFSDCNNHTCVNLPPIADSWVEENNKYANYGTDSELHVKKDKNKDRMSFLKFDLSNITGSITSAKLKMYKSGGESQLQTVYVNLVSNDSWTETGINWDNMPSYSTLCDSQNVGSTNTYYNWTVTSCVQGEYLGDKIISFVARLVNEGEHKDFYSRENEGISKDPYLEVCYVPPVCGNGILEGNEQCEKVGNEWPVCCNSTTCQFKPAGTLCRQGGVCDPAEYCTGQNATCPPDEKSPLSTPCEKDGLFCTVEHCDGNGSCVYWKPYDCSYYNLPEIAQCDYNPDNYLPTFDYAPGVPGICNETTDQCEYGQYSFTHTCADSDLTDNGPVIPVGNGIRNCLAECDGYGVECLPKFVGDYCYYNGSCNTNPQYCTCNYASQQFCPEPGYTNGTHCFWGTRTCTADGCNGLTITEMGCKNYCDSNLGPKDTIGPDIKDIVFVPNPAGGENCLVNITATAIENCTNITYTEYFFDKECIGTGIPIYPADDGSFDNDKQVEHLQAIGVNVSGLSDGGHSLYLRAKNSDGYWGPCVGILIEIDKYPPVVKNITIENASWVDSNGYWICANNGNLTSWICDEPAQSRICNAEFIVDSYPVPGKGYPLYPLDGTWNDSVCEHVYGIIQNNDYSEGRHWVKVRGHDCACHWGKVLEIDPIWFIIDRSYPITTKTVGGPKISCGDNCYYITKNTPITLTCTDPDKGNGYYSDDVTIYWRYQLNNNGTWFEFSHHGSQVTFYYPEDSNHTLEYWCVDKCGNEEPHHFEIDIVDTKPPITTKIIEGPHVEGNHNPIDYYIKSNTVINLTCEDQQPHPVNDVVLNWSIYYSENCVEPWFLISSGSEQNGQKIIVNLNDSCHRIVYQCVDALGNAEAEKIEIDAVDNKPPTISKTIIGSKFFNETEDNLYIDGSTIIHVESFDPEPHPVNQVKCDWDYEVDGQKQGQGGIGIIPPFNITFPEESTHVLTITCRDALGNTVNDTETFIVDKTPPTTTKEYGTPYISYEGKEWITSSTLITLTVEDSGIHKSGIKETKYRVTLVDDNYCLSQSACENAYGSGPWLTYTQPFKISEESCHLIEFYSVDNVDKTEEVKKQCVFVDNTPPITTKTIGEPKYQCIEEICDWYVTQNTEINLTCSDQLPHPVNQVKIYYKIDWKENWNDSWTEGSWVEDSDFVSIKYNNDSFHRLSWYCVDALGNKEETQTEIDVVDTQPPVSTKTLGNPKHVCEEGEQVLYYPNMSNSTDGCYFINSSTSITITCSDQEPHPVNHVKIYYKDWIVGEEEPDWTIINDDHVTIYKTEESAHILKWYCEDALGNAEALHTEYDIVDNTPPEGIKIIGEPKLPCPTILSSVDRELPKPIEPGCLWVSNLTTITLDCDDSWNETVPHPVDHEKMCYRVSFDDSWLTQQYCSRFGGNMEEEWCCVDKLNLPYNITFMEDSFHDLEYYCEDALGNKNQVDVEYFKVDSTPPTTTKTYGQPLVESAATAYPKWINSSTPITLTAEDGGKICAVGVDKTYWRNTIVSNDSCYDMNICLQQTGTGDFQEYTNPIYKAKESCHLIEYYAVDRLGNVEPVKKQCVFVDNTPPITTKTIGEPKYQCIEEICDWYVTQNTEINLTCSDQLPHPVNQVKIYYKIDWKENWNDSWTEGSWVEDSDFVSIKYNNDSFHRLSWYCVDALGNKEETQTEIDVVDTVPPTISKTIIGSKFFNETEDNLYIDGSTIIHVESFDPEPHPVNQVKCDWDYEVDGQKQGQGGIGIIPPFNITFPEESTHVLTITCRDALGNTVNDTETFIVDKTPPTTTKTYSKPYYGNENGDWITSNTQISLSVEDSGKHKSGIKETKYRVTLVDDSYCNKMLGIYCAVNGSGEWLTYTQPFKISEESCHLIEFYSVDNVDKTEEVKKQCVYVDNKPPQIVKTVGKPRTEWDGKDANFYDIADKCWNKSSPDYIECWKITLFTPVILDCADPEPHPVNHEEVCFKVEWDAEDKTQYYCNLVNGSYNKYGDDFCCGLNAPHEFRFNEETEHNLKYYCVDALGNKGEIDEEKFKVEGTTFEIQLNKKWNLVSVPFVMLNDSIDEVFKDIEDKIESVWTYDAVTNQWYVYVPGVGGTLKEMVPGWGYWVKAKSAVNLTIGGSLFSPAKTPPSRKLVHGWNLIGYFGTENQTGYYGPKGNGKTAYCALYSLIDTVVGHPRWSSLVTYWEPDNPYQWKYLGLYDRMDPGAGYWIEMDVNDTYTYSTVCGYWWI